MAKTYNMKWRDEDVELLRKQIRNFNRKVDRLMKKAPPEVKAALPPKMSMKTAKAGIQSRADYNRQLKQISRFTEKGSEELVKTKGGVTAPKFELKEMEAKVRGINAARRKELKRLGLDKPEPGNLPLMGRIEREALKPKRMPRNIRPSGWEEYKRSVNVQSDPKWLEMKDERYRENYFKALDFTFGDKAKDIKEMVNQFDVHDFAKISLNDDMMNIDYVYDPNKQQEVMDNIRKRVKKLLKDYRKNRG